MWKVNGRTDGRSVVTIAHMTLWVRWAKKFLETAHKIEPKLIMSGHWMVPCKLGVITKIGNPRWLPQQFLTYGKMNNSFFLETTNMIESKLYVNSHWMVSCKIWIFYVNLKFKMVANAELSFCFNKVLCHCRKINKCFSVSLWLQLPIIIFSLKLNPFPSKSKDGLARISRWVLLESPVYLQNVYTVIKHYKNPTKYVGLV